MIITKQQSDIFLSTMLFIYLTNSIKYYNYMNSVHAFLIWITILNFYLDKEFLQNSITSVLLFFLLTRDSTYRVPNYLEDTIDTTNNCLVVKGITIYSFIYFILLWSAISPLI